MAIMQTLNKIAAANANTTTAPARIPRAVSDNATIVRLQEQLRIARADDITDDRAVADLAELRNVLDDEGIGSINELRDALVQRRMPGLSSLVITDDVPLSPLFSNIELQSFLNKDSVSVNIPTVAISSTGTFTLAQAPMRWQLTDIIFDGEVGASGKAFLVKLEVLIGGQSITEMRLSEFMRATQTAQIFDNLERFKSFKFGPSSNVQVKITNDNASAGQTFLGYFQYKYKPLTDSVIVR